TTSPFAADNRTSGARPVWRRANTGAAVAVLLADKRKPGARPKFVAPSRERAHRAGKGRMARAGIGADAGNRTRAVGVAHRHTTVVLHPRTAHVPEKWMPVFREGHAQSKILRELDSNQRFQRMRASVPNPKLARPCSTLRSELRVR